jgi:epoxyqueuosine reductase
MLAADHIKSLCKEQGFQNVGIIPAQAATTMGHYKRWIQKGYQGAMSYLSDHRVKQRRSIYEVFPTAKTIIMVSWSYASQPIGKPIAGYATLHEDYHGIIRKRLNIVIRALQSKDPTIKGLVFVDTHPVLEREYAKLSGLGWVGKNTCLISPEKGSLFMLGGVVINQSVDMLDIPQSKNHCGTCKKCIEKCPTQAFNSPYVLDARKCISYLTIEYRGVIASHWIPYLKGHFFGCDICQAVCPWNKKHINPTLRLQFDPIDWLLLNKNQFEKRVRGTALARMTISTMQRNALIQVFHKHGLTKSVDIFNKVKSPRLVAKEQLKILRKVSMKKEI